MARGVGGRDGGVECVVVWLEEPRQSFEVDQGEVVWGEIAEGG